MRIPALLLATLLATPALAPPALAQETKEIGHVNTGTNLGLTRSHRVVVERLLTRRCGRLLLDQPGADRRRSRMVGLPSTGRASAFPHHDGPVKVADAAAAATRRASREQYGPIFKETRVHRFLDEEHGVVIHMAWSTSRGTARPTTPLWFSHPLIRGRGAIEAEASPSRPSSTTWQAATASGVPRAGISAGRSTLERSLASGQRGWNGQPDGGRSGSAPRRRPGCAAARSSRGRGSPPAAPAYRDGAAPGRASRPGPARRAGRDTSPDRSDMWRTTARLWLMNR